MPRLQSAGILIAVEGIDGSGKTTQVERLRQLLASADIPVVASKEPTLGPWGMRIRESASTGRMSPQDELQAFINDRTEHVNHLIIPALERGDVVLLDRYFYSTIAYQGSRGMDHASVRAEMETRFPIPDAVFILDVDPALSIHRISNSRGEVPNQFEEHSSLAEARRIFNSISMSEGIIRIDGMMSIGAVHQQIVEAFIDGPLKAKRCAKSYGCDDPGHCTFRLNDSCEWLKLRGALSSAHTVPA